MQIYFDFPFDQVENMIKMETWILGGLWIQKKSLKRKQSA